MYWIWGSKRHYYLLEFSWSVKGHLLTRDLLSNKKWIFLSRSWTGENLHRDRIRSFFGHANFWHAQAVMGVCKISVQYWIQLFPLDFLAFLQAFNVAPYWVDNSITVQGVNPPFLILVCMSVCRRCEDLFSILQRFVASLNRTIIESAKGFGGYRWWASVGMALLFNCRWSEAQLKTVDSVKDIDASENHVWR